MSRADELFIENCKEILAHGVWDTGQEVRPRWADGAPAHTVKKFGIVNRYDLRAEFPVQTIRKMASRARWTSFCGSGRRSPTTSTTCPAHLGRLGGRERLHRQGLRLPVGSQAPLPRGGV